MRGAFALIAQVRRVAAWKNRKGRSMRRTTKSFRRLALRYVAASVALLAPSALPAGGQEPYGGPVTVEATDAESALEPAGPSIAPLRLNAGCCGTSPNTGMALAGYASQPVQEASAATVETQPPLGLYSDGPLWIDDSGPGYGIGCGSDCAPAWYTRAEAVYFQRDQDASRIGAGAPVNDFDFEFGGRFTAGDTSTA
jgi:hypothetical protein